MMRRTSGRRPRGQSRRRFVPVLDEALERREVLSATMITLTALDNPAPFNGNVGFTVNVAGASGTPAPTGTVTLYDGSKSFDSGTLSSGGTLTTPYDDAFLPGNHAITAVYSGDTNNAPSTSAALTQIVGLASPTVNLTRTTVPGATSDQVTLKANVSTIVLDAPLPAATGTLTFSDGTTTLGAVPLTAPFTTFSTTLGVPGSHEITATYSGDADYSAATSAVVQVASTTTTLTASSNSSALVATIHGAAGSSGTPSGTVSFYDSGTLLGTSALSGGVASLTPTPGLAPGVHAISAAYSGDSSFDPSTGTLSDTVPALVTQTTVTASTGTTSSAGASVTFTATLTFPTVAGQTLYPTGVVNFFDGSTLLGSSLLNPNGVATFTTSSLPNGSNQITAKYSGTSILQSSTSSPFSVFVSLASPSVTLVTPASPVGYGQAVSLKAIVSPGSGGSGVPTGSVEFFDGSNPLGTAVLSGGSATLNLPSLALGSHTITVQYFGDTTFASSNSTASTIVVGNANEQYLNQVYLSLLDRPIDPVGVSGWEAELNAGVARYSIVTAIEGSQEFALTTLAGLSKTLVGTAPTAAEQTAALALQAHGQADMLSLESIVLNSPGFYQTKGGNTNAGFVAAVGQAATGAALTSAQTTSLLAMANAGNRAGVVSTVLGYPATFTLLVNNDYLRYLNRPAEAAGITYYDAELQNKVSPNLVAAQFLASPEYYNDATT